MTDTPRPDSVPPSLIDSEYQALVREVEALTAERDRLLGAVQRHFGVEGTCQDMYPEQCLEQIRREVLTPPETAPTPGKE